MHGKQVDPGRRLRVRVPATTANLGPGFDCLGLALDLYLEVEVEAGVPDWRVSLSGEGAGELPTSPDNLIIRSIAEALAAGGHSLPPLAVRMTSEIPLARGLGSSAAATVAGLLAGNGLLNGVLPEERVLDLAHRMEGHPDNVAPALLGGCVLSVIEGDRLTWTRVPVPDSLRAVLFVPDFAMSTREARAVLPTNVPRVDAIFNLGRAALLVAAFSANRLDLLGVATGDRLHQPYRSAIFPAMPPLIAAAREAGALGACLSGAGSTILAFVTDNGQQVGQAMGEAARALGVAGRVINTRPARAGATIEKC